MQIKNTSARPYHVGGKMIAPGETETFSDTVAHDVVGISDLLDVTPKKPVVEAEIVEYKEVEPEVKKPGRASKDKA